MQTTSLLALLLLPLTILSSPLPDPRVLAPGSSDGPTQYKVIAALVVASDLSPNNEKRLLTDALNVTVSGVNDGNLPVVCALRFSLGFRNLDNLNAEPSSTNPLTCSDPAVLVNLVTTWRSPTYKEELTVQLTLEFHVRYLDSPVRPQKALDHRFRRIQRLPRILRHSEDGGHSVLSYPVNNPRTKKQAWLLEHLESHPSVTPTPAPPEPGPCEFPEADQQALRGHMVQKWSKFRFANTVTQSARDCYDEMKLDAEEYNIQSYVFTSSVELGSPSGQGTWGGFHWLPSTIV
ncbi:MAG: hypothetical protein Q9172_007686 [Xanthocarpia lactea]